MSTVRVRVVSHHPLPLVKVWFEIAILPAASETVYNLKAELCKSIPAFLSSSLTPDEIALDVEDFELLDVSAITVVKPGDVVNIKNRPRPTTSSTRPPKRKHVEDAPGRESAKRKKAAPSPENPRRAQVLSEPSRTMPMLSRDVLANDLSASVSSSSSSSSSSDDDSSGVSSTSNGSTESSEDISDEGDDSQSEDESETVSDSDSTGRPTEVTSNARREPNAIGTNPTAIGANQPDPLVSKSVNLAPPVPPGHGKAGTHARNARRRKRRAFLRADDHTLGGQPDREPRAREHTVTYPVLSRSNVLATNTFLPYDTPPPSAIVNAPTSEAELPMASSTLSNKNKRKGFKISMVGKTAQKTVFDSPARRPRLVPPSERNDVPLNIFVTSVDCEQRSWIAVVDGPEFDGQDEVMIQNETDEPDWDNVSKHWNDLPLVTAIEGLTRGHIVAWKELALNHATFSPELMIFLARVVSTSQLPSTCTVQTLPRPDIKVSGLDDIELEREETELTVDGETVVKSGWRLVIA